MEEKLLESWDDILQYMCREFDIAEVYFRTFINKLSVYSVEKNVETQENELTVLIDDTEIGNSKSFIKEKYSTFLSVSVEAITKVHYNITFIAKSELSELKKEQEKNTQQKIYSSINPNYTFDTFIVGDNNNFAQAASLKVAEEPGGSYNPLFIYGGAGLGKTHLMHAIANHILDHDAKKRVVYVTSETFTNEIVEALRGSKKGSSEPLKEFRKKYRENVDVLLIDDIQFIIGKDSTQQEFFFTFSDLTDNKKQVIISSDKHPSTMTTLDERYRSRFEMGITVDVKPPTYETRMAILRSKVENEHIYIEDEILDYIADNIVSNIRELQGAINKVISFSKLCGKEITMDLAKEALADKINPNLKRKITIDYILEMVADHFGIPINDILSKSRKGDIVYARHICTYLCRNMTNNSLEIIANKIGNRDHSTALHSVSTIEKQLDESNQKTYNQDTVTHIDVLKKKIDPK